MTTRAYRAYGDLMMTSTEHSRKQGTRCVLEYAMCQGGVT